MSSTPRSAACARTARSSSSSLNPGEHVEPGVLADDLDPPAELGEQGGQQRFAPLRVELAHLAQVTREVALGHEFGEDRLRGSSGCAIAPQGGEGSRRRPRRARPGSTEYPSEVPERGPC